MYIIRDNTNLKMNKNKLSLRFCGGVGMATGSNFLLKCTEENNFSIVVDCGLVQGGEDSHKRNRDPFPFNPSEVDFLLITHAHADHIGRIPKLVHDGFKGVIYSTPETRELASLMLDDMVTIFDRESRSEGVLPLYTREDVAHALGLWKVVSYHETLELNPIVSLYPKDSGHVLGSAMLELSIKREGKPLKIVFTGDLGNSPSPLLRDTEIIDDADYMIMESVYGDRNHENREERKSKLADAIKAVISSRGTLVIPAFSLERTQVLLYEMNTLVESGAVPVIPVFLDSPLAIKITKVYKGWKKDFNQTISSEIDGGDDIFNFPKLKFTVHSDESARIHQVKGPKIILAGGGMSEGGRVVHHEAVYLPDPSSILLLVGYQSPNTLGRRLQDGVKSVRIEGKDIEVRARVLVIHGYSSHKDSDNLVEFASRTKDTIKRIFVCMGEPKSSLFLVQKLRDYENLPAFYPEEGMEYPLE